MPGTATKLKDARSIELKGAVTGSASFDGSKNISITTTQSNIAVLTGIITMPEKNSESLTGIATVNYPAGFTSGNCVVISALSHNTNHQDYWSTPGDADVAGQVLGNGNLIVILQSDCIKVRSDKPNVSASRSDVTFKIVLMKV